MNDRHPQINYLEFSSTDLGASKRFFTEAFGWAWTDYGPDYAAFSAASAGLDGGFFSGDAAPAGPSAPLVVLKADDLAAAQATVEAAGGVVVTPAFDFPGGRRFHFAEPGGNVLAVWQVA